MQQPIIITLPNNANVLENLFFSSIEEEKVIISRDIIPQELVNEILGYLDLKQLSSLSLANRGWHYQISQYSNFSISKVLSAALPHLLGIQVSTLEEDLFASYSVPSDAWTILKTFAEDPNDEDELEELSEDPLIWGKVQKQLAEISYSIFFHYEIEIHQDSIQLNTKDITDLTKNIKQKESLNKSLLSIPQSLHGTKFEVRAFYDKIVENHSAYRKNFLSNQFLLRLNRVELLTEEPSSSLSLNSSSNDLLKSQESSETPPSILQPAFDRFNKTCRNLNTAVDNLYCQQLETGEIRLFDPMTVFPPPPPSPDILHLNRIVEVLMPLIEDQRKFRGLYDGPSLKTWLFSEEGLSVLLETWILIKDSSYSFNMSEFNNTFVNVYQNQDSHLPLENIQEKLRLTLSHLSACKSVYSNMCCNYFNLYEIDADLFRRIHRAWILLQESAPSSAIKGNTVGLDFVISRIINFLKPFSQDASERDSNQKWDSRRNYEWR